MSPRDALARLAPRGPLDLIVQFAIVAAAYTAWRYARGAVEQGMGEAFANARDLIALERAIHTFVEIDVQRWSVDTGWPADFAGWWYRNAHFRGSCAALLFVYFFRQPQFRFVRNMLIASFVISWLGYALYPTAPPRFIPELDLDTSSAVTGNNPLISNPGDPLFNPFAAVPSMHVGLSSLFGVTLALLVRPRALKVLFLAYPLLMTYVVVATGNHYWIDGLFGAMTAAAAAGVAIGLGRLRPEWAFRPQEPA